MFGSRRLSDVASHTTTLKISNQEMGNNIEIVKSFEKSGLSIKVVSQKIKNKAKEQKKIIYQNVIKHFGWIATQ